ncbi:hypothetical protein POVCU2_0040820 [Plasmodium ovale curtisi]|uniref:Uncharacterized protein n=1 Tax=Plasmodium ovale curtisi TaxID=864141 RepID=A0A1A8W513_PLAOA|nr:hypothetical protein POVCU2_0040820 [Plasmodium ovale curtisi]
MIDTGKTIQTIGDASIEVLLRRREIQRRAGKKPVRTRDVHLNFEYTGYDRNGTHDCAKFINAGKGHKIKKPREHENVSRIHAKIQPPIHTCMHKQVTFAYVTCEGKNNRPEHLYFFIQNMTGKGRRDGRTEERKKGRKEGRKEERKEERKKGTLKDTDKEIKNERKKNEKNSTRKSVVTWK